MFKYKKVRRMFEADDPRLSYYLRKQRFTLSDVYKDDEDLLEKSIRQHKNIIAETVIVYDEDNILDNVNVKGQSYLMIAIEADNLPIFKLLLEKGVRLDTVDNNRESLWFYLADNPNSEYFALLADKDIDVKGFNLQGETALIYAYKRNRKDICLYLLDKQIFVNHIDKEGNTVLHYTLMDKDLEFSYLLIDYGADIYIQNYQHVTPLDIAKEEGLHSHLVNKVIEYVDRLFQGNNNERLSAMLIDAADNHEFSDINIPFLIAVFAIKYDNKLIFEKIWRNTFLLNNVDYRGKSLLMYCVEFGRLIYARKIIYLESNINLCDNDSRTVLFYIIERLIKLKNDTNSQVEYMLLFDELLDRRIDVNIQDVNGDTVLMLAIKLGLPKIVDQLIDYPGINLDVENNEGKTPLILAYEMKDYRTFHQIIISRKANVNKMDNEYNTVLLMTLNDDNLELFDALIKYGADLNLKYQNGLTILMIAIEARKTRFIAKIFENLNFDVDVQDDSGKTALMHAVLNRDSKVVEALLKCGANPNLEDNEGNTAILYALSSDDFSIARIIRNYCEKQV